MSLIGINAKIERAKHHIFDLQAQIKRFTESGPYEIERYHENETGDNVWVVRVRSDPPPAFATILGDFLNNLRSALDYLAWDLTGGRGSDGLYFPICPTPKDFKAAVKGIKHLGASEAAVQLLTATQAYKGGNGHGLWQLHQLNRREKHRFLMPVGASNASVTVDVPRGLMQMMRETKSIIIPPGIVNVKPANRVFPLKEGTEIYRILAAGKGGNVGMNPKFFFEIAFGEGEILQGDPVLPTLAQFFKLVERTIKPFRPLLV